MEAGTQPTPAEVLAKANAKAEVPDETPQEAPAAPQRERAPVPGSLRDRMQRRTQELAERTTELFPVPRYDNFVAVELKYISWGVSQKAIEANSRVPEQQMQNTAAEEIVKATVAFYEILEEPNEQGEHFDLITDASTWKELAVKLGGVRLPEVAGDRVALVALCSDQGVIALNGLFRRWLGGADTGLRSQVMRDF